MLGFKKDYRFIYSLLVQWKKIHVLSTYKNMYKIKYEMEFYWFWYHKYLYLKHQYTDILKIVMNIKIGNICKLSEWKLRNKMQIPVKSDRYSVHLVK